MNSLIENFLERPTSHKIGLWVGSLVLITYIFWQFFYSTQSKEYSDLSSKVNTLTTQIAQETRLAKNLGKFSKEVKDLELKFKFALQELPDKREIPDLLS